MKKIFSFVTTALIVFNVCTSVCFADEIISDGLIAQETEEIKYSVNHLSEKIYNKRTMDCYPVDISSVANRGYADEVEGDGVGGWSDQGPKNDLSNFNLRGINYIYNIPFNFIEPDSNNGKSCIMLRGQNDESCPVYVEVPVNDKAEGMYVIHGSPWTSKGKAVGRYGYIYEDGTKASFEMICGVHVADFWGSMENEYMKIAWTGSNLSSPVISLNLFALNNPHPEKVIKKLTFESYGDYTYIGIVGVTLARSGFSLPANSKSSQNYLRAASAGLWAKAEFADEEAFKGSIMDSSMYLDAPAGKHGKLTAKGEDLIFADGTKAKFWGTNIVGDLCYPDKQSADEMALRIARCGYNLVRFVNMDNSPIDDDKLDRLAYFVNQLEQRGIYSYFSLLGNRSGDGDDIKDGWKLEGLLDDELIEKQVEFAKQLFGYTSRYNSKTLAKSPSLVMVDFANRNTMFELKMGNSTFTFTSEKYQKMLKEKFNQYLKNKYTSTAKLKRSWKVLYDDEKIENGTVDINGNWKYGLFADDVRRKDVYEFFASLEQTLYNKMNQTIKSLGFEGLSTSATNDWDNFVPFHSYAQSKYADFVAVNGVGANFFKHEVLEDGLWCLDYDSIVCGDRYNGNEFLDFAESRISGKPYIVSEWGASTITPTFYETPVLMSVISAQQNWTPIQYCFAYNKLSNDKYEDLYSTYQNPVHLALTQLSSAIYYNTDELDKEVTVNYSTKSLYLDKKYSGINTPNINKKSFYEPDFTTFYTNKSRVDFNNKAPTQATDGYQNNVIENKNFNFDMIDGKFFVKNSKVNAFVGKSFVNEKIGRLSFEIYSGYAFTGLIAKDDKDITNSEKMLFMIGARTLNSDMDMTSIKVLSKGTAPIIYDAVVADITIDGAAGYKVYALDNAGQRLKQISTVDNADGSLSFSTNSDTTAMNYEIIKED